MDRGKTGSKHHLIVEAHGIPLAAITTGGNRNDVTQLIPLIQAIPPVRGKRGQPLCRPKHLPLGRGRSDRVAALVPPPAHPLGDPPHIRDLSTSTSQPGANGSKPCSTSQRTPSRLRNDHHARITSRSTSVP
ncbi:transposase [Streptomyces rapamycinicus]|uniref:Transposase n=1 Tax=Streptomyces rhizosphaericus TaxID=114699 RepID=A0A6G4AU63_9ACTN|nr:transposase [Streptomyces rhizosphaericus]